MLKGLKKLSQNNCLDCALYKNNLCNWWDAPKKVPDNIINKGCKFWRDDYMQLIIDRFDGEIVIRRYNVFSKKYK